MNLEQYKIRMWPEEKKQAFRKALLDWYDENKRDLPWRKTQDPYAIWVSEIMLQQTRVDTVIPYYERFLEWFPTIEHLANASEQKLLKAWEGLGYYSRVRNMQQAARQMMELYNGTFPNTYNEISRLKGIGPYTSGAISSIAFGLVEPAVDGNVMRVLSRLFEIPYDIGESKNRKIYQAVAEELIDPDRPGDFNQALMDLGADIESPKRPTPELSPVKEFSAAYLNGTMHLYPIKKAKKKAKPYYYHGFIIQNENGEFLLEKNEADLLQGFWHFPLIEVFHPEKEQLELFPQEKDQSIPNADIPTEVQFESIYQFLPQWEKQQYETITHIFSHQKWSILLKSGTVVQQELFPTEKSKELKWVHPTQFSTYPFAKPQQKMWESYYKKKS